MPGIIIGCFLIFIVLIILGFQYNSKTSGVALKDEWTETPIILNPPGEKTFL